MATEALLDVPSTKRVPIVVNARTGEVQGERPWSWIKISCLVLLVAGIVFLREGPAPAH